jgi:hypothetical protein
LLAQAGINAREREAADKLQKLILEELHHRIKNTLASSLRGSWGGYALVSTTRFTPRSDQCLFQSAAREA